MENRPFTVTGDLYNRIFAVQTSNPEVVVDYTVWNRIFASLPRDYLLPDLPVITFIAH
ncbi:MAG TPA: hypothetical protein VMS09_17645 [Paenibacillus sp.]|uniref:hypothetical protein n=1 Tax=Paenibacillus sp. TaxID=58172 RepID=UPI0028D2DF62|nr:hypothetical protein [Paenibacillus sp.]HUC93811.1 hypothetical protein [Paenibacillus sp.]